MAKIPSHILRMYVEGDTLLDALPHLRETYCGPIAYEIEHIASHRQRLWLREAIESSRFRQPLGAEEQNALLRRLTEVDALERFMHKAYLGQKQFSIEGLDMTVPMLDELIQLSAARGAREVVIGMAHRGRLNVLAHNLGRPYGSIFAEFEGTSTLEPITTIPQGGTGDVKYHHGAQGSYQLPSRESIIVRLESNPSHLEFVAPVAAGATRAAQTTRQGPHAHRDTNAAIPIIIHGDAAFPGQGVVAETFNLQALDGYTVGGTIHIIQNNQVGFTTDPDDARSTTWASDLAKGYDVPIIHVNADNVPACIAAVRLAFAFRQEFGHDVLIDLIGYRRFGHNEADEPRLHPARDVPGDQEAPARTRAVRPGADRAGVVTEQESTEMTDQVWAVLTEEHQQTQAADRGRPRARPRHRRVPARPHALARGQDRGLRRPPEGAQRRAAGGARRVHGPSQAGPAARAAPQRRSARTERIDLGPRRGARVRVAADRGDPDPPDRPGHRARHLQPAPPGPARPEDRSGALRRSSTCPARSRRWSCTTARCPRWRCLGFEYGYSQEAPETLVLWEAQFGDFVNGAQVIIDQFIMSGLAKWGQTSRADAAAAPRLRGVGPEHSSARLERFLQLAAEGNIRVANPTTPAQYFHLLPSPGADRQAASAGGHDAEEPAAPAAGHEPRRGARPRAASSRCWPSPEPTARRSRG